VSHYQCLSRTEHWRLSINIMGWIS
jgi:hypothetical protein